MWFTVNDHNYLGKKILRDNCLSIFVSDLKQIWCKFLSNDELLTNSKKLNPLFDAPELKLREMTLRLFDDNDNVMKETTQKKNVLTLKLQSSKKNVKFVFEVDLLKDNVNMLYNEFTLPIMLTLARLQEREKKLIQIIKEKDVEINEQKQGNSEFVKNLNATKPFVEEEFNAEEPTDFSTVHIKVDPIEFLKCINYKVTSIKKELHMSSKLTSAGDCEDNSNQRISTSKSGPKHIFKNSVNLNHTMIKKRKRENKIF